MTEWKDDIRKRMEALAKQQHDIGVEQHTLFVVGMVMDVLIAIDALSLDFEQLDPKLGTAQIIADKVVEMHGGHPEFDFGELD